MKSEQVWQNHSVWALQDARNVILISPDRGARILQWKVDGREVILWPDSADWTHWNKIRGGNPILFPFIARHFVDGKHELWRDSGGIVRSMPQHGFARDAFFRVVDDANAPASSLRMRLSATDATHDFYPFQFQFDVVVTLLPESNLEIRFETTNLGLDLMPYYAGHHFYLNIPSSERKDWRLNLPCASWARQNSDGSIMHEETTSELLRLDDPTLIDRFQVRPLGSRVTLFNPKTNQRLLFELKSGEAKSVEELSPATRVPWYAVTTWSQTPESDFYCIEPWLGLPNAIHHREGLRLLSSGMTEIATCVLDGRGW